MTTKKNTLTIYINNSPKYGNQAEVTVADYRELNPKGNFTVKDDGIYEDDEKIAEAYTSIKPKAPKKSPANPTYMEVVAAMKELATQIYESKHPYDYPIVTIEFQFYEEDGQKKCRTQHHISDRSIVRSKKQGLYGNNR